MEKLEHKKNKLIHSFEAFQRATNLYQKRYDTVSIEEQETYTASVIKHFELCYEMLWKLFKLYLFEKFGTDTTGSKTIFRACYDHKIVTEEDLDKLLRLVEIRNMTTHIYDEETADQICHEIFLLKPVLEKMIRSLCEHS